MKQALGILAMFGVFVTLYVVAPLVTSTWNAWLRPHYVSRGIIVEYQARLHHWRIYRFHYAYVEMDCGDGELRPATVLDLPEFEQTPREFLAREMPECTNVQPRSLNFPIGNSPLADWPD